jgi:hypothetical protein
MHRGPHGNTDRSVVLFAEARNLDVGVIDDGSALVDQAQHPEFERFVNYVEPRLRRALVACLRVKRGREATADALIWAWEHWGRVGRVSKQVGYSSGPGKAPCVVARSRSRSREMTIRSPGSSVESGPLWQPFPNGSPSRLS